MRNSKLSIALFKINTWLKNNGYILISIIIGLSLGIGIPYAITTHNAIITSNYKKVMAIATSFVENEQYNEAMDVLRDIRFDYTPAKEYYDEVSELCDLQRYYDSGVAYMENGMYSDAIHEFANCIDYKNAEDLLDDCVRLLAD